MDGESSNYSAFIWKTFETSGEGENVVRFQQFFLLAYFFIKTHGKINNSSDFIKMSKIWTGLTYTPTFVIMTYILVVSDLVAVFVVLIMAFILRGRAYSFALF